jgi:hypothetical protein
MLLVILVGGGRASILLLHRGRHCCRKLVPGDVEIVEIERVS